MALLEAGAVIVFCNKKHLPSGVLLPLASHTELVVRLHEQLAAALPAQRRCWQALVRAKIQAQANALPARDRPRLERLVGQVRSGDPDNCDAQAAKIYWPSRFPAIYQQGDNRNPEGTSRFNSLLNYGYAILRAALARALVAAGLQPALGVFHHRRDNPFCLADDLIEPLRPLVDNRVAQILQDDPPSSPEDLTQPDRRELLNLLVHPLKLPGAETTTGPLMATLPRYIANFYRFLTKQSERFSIPVYDP